jgi:hypothetical protein
MQSCRGSTRHTAVTQHVAGGIPTHGTARADACWCKGPGLSACAVLQLRMERLSPAQPGRQEGVAPAEGERQVVAGPQGQHLRVHIHGWMWHCSPTLADINT